MLYIGYWIIVSGHKIRKKNISFGKFIAFGKAPQRGIFVMCACCARNVCVTKGGPEKPNFQKFSTATGPPTNSNFGRFKGPMALAT